MKRRINLQNSIYGSWVVLREDISKNGKRMWICRCKCGKEVSVNQENLRNGRSTSCLLCRPHYKKHGLAEKHRLYGTWKSMRSRCNNKFCKSYKYYGGRGITVCKEWDDFTTFLIDMEPSHKEGLTLDRKDNSKGYNKDNCKWSTKIEQATNQDKSLKLIWEGEIVTEAELSRLTGVRRSTIQCRRRAGASVEEMVYGFS